MSYVEERLSEINQPAKKAQPRPIYKHIEKWRDKNGNLVHYYRIDKGPRKRLPDPDKVGAQEFDDAYRRAAGEITKRHEQNKQKLIIEEIGPPGFVYFVRDGDEVKIGFSSKVKSRMRSLQTARAGELETLCVIPGNTATEKFFHERFKDYHIRGEWFRLTGILAEFLSVAPARPLR